MKSDKIKLIVAIVIFAIAAVIIVMQLVGGGGQPELAPPQPGEQPRGGPRAVTPGN